MRTNRVQGKIMCFKLLSIYWILIIFFITFKYYYAKVKENLGGSFKDFYRKKSFSWEVIFLKKCWQPLTFFSNAYIILCMITFFNLTFEQMEITMFWMIFLQWTMILMLIQTIKRIMRMVNDSKDLFWRFGLVKVGLCCSISRRFV